MLREILKQNGIARMFGVYNQISKPLLKEGDAKTANDAATFSRAEAFHYKTREIPLIFTNSLFPVKFPALVLHSTTNCNHSNLNAFIGRSKLQTLQQNKPVIISDELKIDYCLIRDVSGLIKERTIVSDFPLHIPNNIVHCGDLLSFASELSLYSDKPIVVWTTQSMQTELTSTKNIVHIAFDQYTNKLGYDSVYPMYLCDDIFSTDSDRRHNFVCKIAERINSLKSGKHLIVCS